MKPRSAPPRMRTAILLMILALPLAGCANPTGAGGGSASGQHSVMTTAPARATFIDYGDFMRLSLVNEAHTDPVEYYSEVRSNASTKITSNEILAATIEYFDELGFSQYAQQGFAPRQGAKGELQSLEIETETGVRHLLYGQQASPAARKAFVQCVMAWQEIYNHTPQAQAMSNRAGGDLFEAQQQKTKKGGNKR